MDDGLPRPCQDLPPQHLLAQARSPRVHDSWEFKVRFLFFGSSRSFFVFVFGSSRSFFVCWEFKVFFGYFCFWEFKVQGFAV